VTLIGRTMVQEVTRGPLNEEVDVGFVVDEVALGRITATIIPPMFDTQ
jgi:hypothetical protein